jgi:hypothetical protein
VPGIDTQTVLLLHCDGSHASTTFTDSSFYAHGMTAGGTAAISTATSVFGGASGTFDASSLCRLTSTDSDDWSFGSGDFTIDLRIYFSTTSGSMAFVAQADDAGNGAWVVFHNHAQQGLKFEYSTNGTAYITKTATWAPVINTFYHVAVLRVGTDLKFHVAGTQIGSTHTMTESIHNPVRILEVGMRAGALGHKGFLDEIRISKGIARWTGNFTPPTEAYSVDAVVGGMTMKGYWGDI